MRRALRVVRADGPPAVHEAAQDFSDAESQRVLAEAARLALCGRTGGAAGRTRSRTLVRPVVSTACDTVRRPR